MSGIDVNPAYPPFDPDEDALRQDSPEASPSPAEAGESGGNRPAEGARHASPGEVLSEDFVGGQNAGDFLGLDLEFDAPDAAAEGQPLTGGLELSEPSLGSLAPQEEAPAAYHPEEAAMLATEVEPDSFGAVDFQPDGEYEGYDEDEGFDPESGDFDPEEGELSSVEVPVHSPLRLGLITLAVAGLAFGGVWFGRDFLSPETGGGAPPRVTPSPVTVADAGDTGGELEPADAAVAPVEDFGLEPQVGPNPAPIDVANDDAALARLTDFLHGALVESPGGRPTGTTTPAPTGGEVALLDPTTGLTLEPALTQPVVTPSAEFFESFNWGDPGSLDVVWREASIPLEAISSPARVMLPRVGRVRVTLDSGEVLDGTLVAVGQERVWIDAKVGRIGLDGAVVAGIERLAGPAPLDSQRVEIATGDRVKILLPGGPLFARVLSRTGEHVTVTTESGARITLRDPEIERVGSTRVHLVDDGTL